MTSTHCPLCFSNNVADYHQDKKRHYLQCKQCKLVFVPSAYHLTPEQEKTEYDKHENTLDDQGYLTFLSRAANPLLDYLHDKYHNKCSNELTGLDFGCGPAPALAESLKYHGFNTEVYDPYFYPDKNTLKKTYDFVTCTEVVEHFNTPKQSFELLFSVLKPNAVLVIMTKLVINQDRFKNWHYKNDPTHISFFSTDTFEYLAQKYQFTYQQQDNDVIFLLKR